MDKVIIDLTHDDAYELMSADEGDVVHEWTFTTESGKEIEVMLTRTIDGD